MKLCSDKSISWSSRHFHKTQAFSVNWWSILKNSKSTSFFSSTAAPPRSAPKGPQAAPQPTTSATPDVSFSPPCWFFPGRFFWLSALMWVFLDLADFFPGRFFWPSALMWVSFQIINTTSLCLWHMWAVFPIIYPNSLILWLFIVLICTDSFSFLNRTPTFLLLLLWQIHRLAHQEFLEKYSSWCCCCCCCCCCCFIFVVV